MSNANIRVLTTSEGELQVSIEAGLNFTILSDLEGVTIEDSRQPGYQGRPTGSVHMEYRVVTGSGAIVAMFDGSGPEQLQMAQAAQQNLLSQFGVPSDVQARQVSSWEVR